VALPGHAAAQRFSRAHVWCGAFRPFASMLACGPCVNPVAPRGTVALKISAERPAIERALAGAVKATILCELRLCLSTGPQPGLSWSMADLGRQKAGIMQMDELDEGQKAFSSFRVLNGEANAAERDQLFRSMGQL
jgi:hypothetical protein